MKHLLLITLLFTLALLLVACCADLVDSCAPVETISPVAVPASGPVVVPDIGAALERFEKWIREYQSK